jgi:CelD/BcsL family acetyltransferase involved in cellulose biosynthesis
MMPTGVAPADLRVEVVTSNDQLRELSGDWRRLATSRGNAFVTPEWFFAALRTVDAKSTPFVPVASDQGGELRGLLPLVQDEMGGLRFGGAGPADRLHPAAASADESAVAAAAAEALARRLGRRQVIRFDRVDSGADWPKAFAASWRPRLAIVERAAEDLPYVDLEGFTWEQYLATRSRGLRSQLGRKMRSLEREHEVAIRQPRAAGDVAEALDALFHLHDLRWSGSGRVSSFDKERVRELHREFVPAALEQGWLRLCVLEVDERPIAAWYGWSLDGRFAYYQAGFDPAWSSHSPGLLLLGETVRLAIAEGASEYDLLRGDESFKQRFANGVRKGRTLLLARRSHPIVVRDTVTGPLRAGWRRIPQSGQARVRAAFDRLPRIGAR